MRVADVVVDVHLERDHTLAAAVRLDLVRVRVRVRVKVMVMVRARARARVRVKVRVRVSPGGTPWGRASGPKGSSRLFGLG